MKIQRKLFLIFAIGIFFFVAVGVLSNYLFLENYFLYKSRENFIGMSQTIKRKVETEKEDIGKFIVQYGKKENVRIILLDSALKVEEISYYKRKGNTNIPLKKIRQLVDEKGENEYIYKIYERKKLSSSKIFFLTETENGKYLLLMKNSKGVRESVLVANEFYLIIGGIVLAVGLCITAIFSKRITEPIVRMSEVTREMERLHFGQKIPENGRDEIAELAHSINQMSEQLEVNICGLERDIQSRKQLVRDLSHELKTPIAVVKGYADGLRYGVAENKEEREKYCRIISNECERMDKMVQEMLLLSRLEQIVLSSAEKAEPISIYEIVEQLSERYGRIIEQKSCQYNIQNLQDIKLIIDKKCLEHIIDNLLGNAFKYVSTNGLVKVDICKNEYEVEFSVFNTGEKIPQDKLERVWDAFYKLDHSRKREQGHGIGLSIVKSAVELYNGTVFAKNREGGVVFGFRFPKIMLEEENAR